MYVNEKCLNYESKKQNITRCHTIIFSGKIVVHRRNKLVVNEEVINSKTVIQAEL